MVEGNKIFQKQEKPAAPKETSLLRNIIGFILAIVFIPGLLFAGTCFPLLSSIKPNWAPSTPMEVLATLGTIVLCDGAVLGVAALFLIKTRNPGLLWALILMPIALYAYFLSVDTVRVWAFALIAIYSACVVWQMRRTGRGNGE